MIRTNELQLLNMQRSEAARRDICRGITLGLNPFSLLMIAIKCIAELSGDSSFSSMCSRSIDDIYGAGLNNTEYNAYRASELEASITQLDKSLRTCTKQDTRERLKIALRLQKKSLKACKNRQKMLEKCDFFCCFLLFFRHFLFISTDYCYHLGAGRDILRKALQNSAFPWYFLQYNPGGVLEGRGLLRTPTPALCKYFFPKTAIIYFCIQLQTHPHSSKYRLKGGAYTAGEI